MKKPAVLVCMPTYGKVDPRTLASLTALLFGARGLAVDFIFCDSCFIDRARCEFVKTALTGEDLPRRLAVDYDHRDLTHILMVDSDMLFPTNTVAMLLRHRKPVVGGLAYHKLIEDHFAPVPYTFTDPDYLTKTQILDIPTTGLLQVDGTGMGCTLIDLDVFRAMQEHFGDEDWFRSHKTGEDIHFARRLKVMGIPHYLDCEVECGHIGTHVVTRQEWDAIREMQAQGQVA